MQNQMARPAEGIPAANALPMLEAEMRPGTMGPVGEEQVQLAEELLKKYKAGKASLDNRIVENERWFQLRNWEQVGGAKNKHDPKPSSAWLFNSLVNKHADAMDNLQQPNVLPREESDEATAKVLSSVVPAILDACDYEKVYDKVWWYKLKTGTGVYGVFWDPEKENGLGNIDIRELDLLNLFWAPGITDIQKSPHVFHVEMRDREELQMEYPELADKLNGSTVEVTKYRYDDSVDETDKVAVVDWYYKLRTMDGRRVVHFCKFACGQVLYASENVETYAQSGFYDHGKYPIVLDVLFPVAGSPAGFGYVDVCRSPQMYIDKLDQALLKNAVMSARTRYFARKDSGVSLEDYTDLSKDIVPYSGSGNPNEQLMQIQVPQMGPYAMAVRTAKIDELKETSGNRDFQQGSTAQGITAASAISALQEAGSKTSRDMIKSGYRAHEEICTLVIELIRQFYTEPRMMRITGESGQSQYVQVSSAMLGAPEDGTGYDNERVPVFDIKVSAQKASPFSTVAQNERAKELYGLGFFRPDLADQALATLEMMQFDGIEKVRSRIEQNGTMLQKIQQMSQLLMTMAQAMDAQTGSQFLPQIAQLTGQSMDTLTGTPERDGIGRGDMQVNSIGDAFNRSRRQTAEAARADAASKSTPKV